MSTSNSDYSKMTDKASPSSPVAKNCVMAFLFGGGICAFAQILNTVYQYLGMNDEQVKLATPSTIIIITAILTGIGVYDNLARIGGAGAFVPISGFANSVVSPALEFKHEGMILGTGAQMFSIAGPVLVYGTSSAFLYGVIAYIFRLY